VQLVGEGKTSKEIATTLGMTLKTAETHRSNIMLKLKLHSTVELVLYAVRNEIVHVQLPSFAVRDYPLRKWQSARCRLETKNKKLSLASIRGEERPLISSGGL
jgi:hypothetical protein